MVVPGAITHGIGAQTQRAALVDLVALAGHEVDDLVCAASRRTRRSSASAMPATWRANSMTAICIPRQMPKIGDVVRRGRTSPPGSCLRCPGRRSRRARGCRPACRALAPALSFVIVLGVDPVDVHVACPARSPRGAAPRRRTDTRRAAGHICRPDRSSHVCRACFDALDHVLPLGQIRRRARRCAARGRRCRKSWIFSSISGASYSTGSGDVFNHAVGLDVAEHARFSWKMDRSSGSSQRQDDDVRAECPCRCSSLTECWVGLDLCSSRAREVGHQRDMDEQAVLAARPPEQTCRMASRKGWDSISPVVPPISVMTTSASGLACRPDR